MPEHSNNLIALLTVLPLVAAILSLLVRGFVALQRLIGAVFIAGSLVTCAALLATIPEGGAWVSTLGLWKAPFGIAVVFDPLSGLLLLVAQVVALACYLHAWSTIPKRIERGWWHPLFHLLLMGVNFSFVTGDLFNLFVAFELMLLSSYSLLVLGGERRQISQAYKYVMLNLLGSAVFVLSAGLIYGLTGTLNFADLARFVAEARAAGDALPGGFRIASVMLLVVFALKAAVFPLWFWLPDTYHTMPGTLGALFGALLSKVGVYALLRLYPMVFATPGGPGTGLVLDILMVMAGLTMVLAILGAMGTHEVRRLLALVLASHVGFLVFGIALMTPESHAAVLFYMTQEMLVVAALFLAAGVISEVAGSDDLHEIGGLYRRAPWLAVAFLIAALSLFGAPPLSGFHGKVLLIREGFLAGQPLLTAALLVTALLTLAAVLKVWAFGFWSPLKGERLELPPGATFGPRRPMRPAMAGVWVLVIASLLFGIGAEPMIGYAMDATDGLLEPRGYVEAVLGPGAWPAEPASGLAEAAAIPAAEVIP